MAKLINITKSADGLSIGSDISAESGIVSTSLPLSLLCGKDVTSGITTQLMGIMAANDYWRLAGGATASDSGYLEIATADNGNEPIYVRQYNGKFTGNSRTLTLLDANGNTEMPGNITAQGALTVNGGGTITGELTLKSPLKITSGGTGANSIATASRNLLQLSNNAITNTSSDTVANWGAKGHCISFYTATGQLNNQPSQYGILLSLGVNANEVHQLWMTQTNGNLCHRGGNLAGWDGTWRIVLDSTNYNSYALPLSGGKITGELTLNSPLKIASGGTGASSKKAAAHNLIDLGNNIISSTSNDTGATWKNFGLGIAGFNIAGRLNGQPTQYGTLLNMVTNNKGDFSQLWIAQANGETYSRASNGNNLSTTWRRHLDSDNLNLWFKCGTASPASGTTLKYGIYIQY